MYLALTEYSRQNPSASLSKITSQNNTASLPSNTYMIPLNSQIFMNLGADYIVKRTCSIVLQSLVIGHSKASLAKFGY